MVDPSRIRQLLDRIAEEEKHLRRLAKIDVDQLLADHDRMHAVKYGLVVAIEAAINAGRHVIASQGLQAPTPSPRCSPSSAKPNSSQRCRRRP